jgi:hypothetical protein
MLAPRSSACFNPGQAVEVLIRWEVALIRFVAYGVRGRVLGMGLSFRNLDELARDNPILFDLAPYDSSGQLLITCGDERTLKRTFAAFPSAHVITLTPRTLNTLRSGQAVIAPLDQLGVPGFADGALFAGETEFELIELLRASGLVDPDTQIEGLEEYFRHERGEVEDCPSCRLQRHTEARLPPLDVLALAGLLAPESGKGAPLTGPAPGREDWRERIYRHPYLVVVAALAVCALLALAIESLKSDPPPIQAGPPPMSERTRAWIASDQARRRLLEERAPHVLALGTGEPAREPAPCTAQIVAPPALGQQLIGVGRRGLDDLHSFEETLEQVLLVFHDALDVMPGSAAGVGPVRRRLHWDSSVDHGNLSSPYRLTFVVDAWTDPTFADEIAQLPPEAPIELRSDSYTPGSVTGRLWVWSLDERAFVCTSPPVTATTPPLILQRNRPGVRRGLWDDPLLKARIETLLGGAREAASRLTAVAADKR